MKYLRRFLSHRLMWLALLVAVGIGALFARTIWTIRTGEWNYAVQTNGNLARTLERGLGSALESFDKSLEGVARDVVRPDIWALSPELRARVVFDHSLRARGAGYVLVLDAKGNVVLDSAQLVPRKVNLADRDFFTALSGPGNHGLFIGQPVPSRVTGVSVLPIARAYHAPDGRFAGVVVGGLSLGFLNELFSSLDMGLHSGVRLLRTDGVVLLRFPYGDADGDATLADTPTMQRFEAEAAGSFVSPDADDGVERLHSFRSLGQYPLILDVAQSTQTILAQWQRSAWVLGGFAAALMGASLGLAALFLRELGLRQKVSARLREAERSMRTILDSLPSMIGYWDARLHNQFANKAYFDWFGVPPEQLRGRHIRELLGPELFERDRPYLERALRGEPQLFERTIVDARGCARYAIVSFVPDNAGSGVHGIFVQVTDISERKRMEQELFEEKERVRLTLQCIGDAVVCSDARGVVTYLNPAAEALTGWQAFHAAGRDAAEVLSLRSTDGDEPLPSGLHQALDGMRAMEAQRAVVVHRGSGRRFQVEITVSAITDRHGHVTGSVAVLRDVGEAVAMAARMNRLAQYDALTDLPNRVLLQDRAQQAIAQAGREGKSLAVMYLDLDGFKAVNDGLGHDVGDQLLVQFAQRLKAAVRGSDTVCRQGGDEFVVLLPGIDGAEPACAVARKILAVCDEPFALAGQSLQIGLSGGIALYPEHGDSFAALARHADAAMYAAKRGGRMRFMLYRGEGAEPAAVLPASA